MEVAVRPTLSGKAQKDLDLVQQAINGNEQAYSLLMNRHYGAVYKLMVKMINDAVEAEDLTMEAFGKAFHKLKNYMPQYAFTTWLYKIAVNNCIDHIRKKRIDCMSIDECVQEDSDLDFASNIRSYALDPEQQVIRAQRMTHMRSAVGQLHRKYRIMIEMRFFDELSYNEISEELNMPLGTVKAQLFRAKELLHEVLQKPVSSAYFDVYH